MNLQNSGEGCRENADVRHRPRRRTIQYSEVSVMETKSRGVLDPPVKPGDDVGGWSIVINVIARSEATKQSSSFVIALDCFVDPVIGRAFARPGGSQ
jgi:hypothetical protein